MSPNVVWCTAFHQQPRAQPPDFIIVQSSTPIPRACPHCGSANLHVIFPNADYISGESFDIEQCRDCGVAQTILPANFAGLSRYYGNTYYGKKGSRFPGPMESLIRFFRQRRVDEMTRPFGSPGAALDIGCGRALTLALLKQRGWRCEGTEFSEELASAARENYGIPVHVQPTLAACGFDAASFDLISMYHVLEHAQNPFNTLIEIRRILKPGGFFHVEVPNLASAQAKLGKGKWFHLDTPRHLWHFDTPTLTALLKEAGFEIVATGSHSLEYGYYGFWQTALNLLTSRMNAIYDLLKGNAPSMRDLLVSVVGAIPAAIITFPAEIIACLIGRGAVIKIVARPSV